MLIHETAVRLIHCHDRRYDPMKNSPSLTYIFLNPNSPDAFEETMKKILLEKLLAEFAYPERLPAAG